MSNNIWTYGQQHIVFGRIAKEEEEARLAKQEKLKANAPKPGARPDRAKKNKGGGSAQRDAVALDGAAPDAEVTDSGNASSDSAAGNGTKDTGQSSTQHVVGSKPKPGAKPSGGASSKSTSNSGSGPKKQGSNQRNKRGGKKGRR